MLLALYSRDHNRRHRTGRFSHELVRGEYRMVGQTVALTITHKHWLVPRPVVEFQLRKLSTPSHLYCSLRAPMFGPKVFPDALLLSSRRFPCPEAPYRGDDLAGRSQLVQYLVSTRLCRPFEVRGVEAGT